MRTDVQVLLNGANALHQVAGGDAWYAFGGRQKRHDMARVRVVTIYRKVGLVQFLLSEPRVGRKLGEPQYKDA